MIRLLAIQPGWTFQDRDGRFFGVIQHEDAMSEVMEISTHKLYAWPNKIKVKLIKIKSDGSES